MKTTDKNTLFGILLIFALWLFLPSCEKLRFDPENPGISMTLDGENYPLKPVNAISAVPGMTLDFNVTVDGHGNTVKMTDTREGTIGTLCRMDSATGEGLYRITALGMGYSTGSSVLEFTIGENKVSYTFNVTVNGLVFDIPESVTCTPATGEETTIPFSFRTDTDEPSIEARVDESNIVEIVSINYTPTKAGDASYSGTITVRNTSDNDTRKEKKGKIILYDSRDKLGNNTKKITVVQDCFTPEKKEGCVYFSDWNFKDAMVAIADTDADGEVSFEEALAITKVDVSYKDIKNIEGLNEFRNIEWLDVSGNRRLKELVLDEITSYYKLKYVKAVFEDDVERVLHFGGCYPGPSRRFITDSDPTGRAYKNVRGQFPKYYESQDFYENKSFVLKEATKGGDYEIKIEFSTYAVDLDYKSGAVDDYINTILDAIFTIEPYKTFKDYFGIYVNHSVATNTKTAESDIRNLPEQRKKEWYEYYKKYTEKQGLKISIGSHFSGSGTFEVGGKLSGPHTTYPGAISMAPETADRFCAFDMEDLGQIVLHEMGHAIAMLRDQYYGRTPWHPEINPNNAWDSNNPNEVPWNRLLNHEQYKGRVGIFECPYSEIESYYPSEFFHKGNLMQCEFLPNIEDNYYDSACRWFLYKKLITELNIATDEDTIWDMFVEYDKVNNGLPQ